MVSRWFAVSILLVGFGMLAATCTSSEDGYVCNGECAGVDRCSDYFGVFGDKDIYQEIPTYGGKDVEFYQIGSDYYFSTANQFSVATGFLTSSDTYRWDVASGTGFVLHQKISTLNSIDVEFMTFDSKHYLFLTNGRAEGKPDSNAKAYIWDGSQFAFLQDLGDYSSFGIEAFVIEGDLYVAVADTYTSQKVYLYKLDGGVFTLHQTLDAHMPVDSRYFSDKENHYLLIANAREGTDFNTSSYLYIWKNNKFEKWQDIATSNAEDWGNIDSGGSIYVLGANLRTGSGDDYSVRHPIYKLVDKKLIPFQYIKTTGARDIHGFKFNDVAYFAVAQSGDGNTTLLKSPILKFDNDKFCIYAYVKVYGAANIKNIQIGNDKYLFVVQNGDPARSTQDFNSLIYKWPN